MMAFVHAGEVLPGHVGVDLGRRDVGVAEHGLHRAEVRAAEQEVRREGMPQLVRADAFVMPARAAWRRTIAKNAWRVMRRPRAVTNTARSDGLAQRPRASASQRRTRSTATSPIGTRRLLLPLPNAATKPASRFTSPSSSVTSSLTRRPAAYIVVSIAASRRPSGAATSGAARRRATSSRVSTDGRRRERLGASTSSVGSLVRCLSATRCLKSPRRELR